MSDTAPTDQPDPTDSPSQSDPPHVAGIVDVTQPARTRTPGPSIRQVLMVLAMVVVIVLQVMILQRQDTTSRDLGATRAALTDLQVDVGGIDTRLDDLDEQVGGLGAAPAVSDAGSGQSNAISAAPGSLPLFSSPENDVAVRDGYVLGDLTAVEYYGASQMTVAPADGTSRVWLVWAHWCPYCQQELPELAQWWPANADRFPNTDLVTVTTSMDDARGNPLTPYLESSQFPFPVLVDPDLRIATQFGTNAFPFWVVTDGDGKVIFRVAGAIGIDAVEAIFTQLEDLSST